jgi:hypothetical protein
MSVLGTNTSWGSQAANVNSFYIPYEGVPANVSSIGTTYPGTNANISSIYTDHISIDGIGLDASSAGGGQLLVNGVAVATVNQNVSSIANWAQYPALSSITYASGGGTGGSINMNIASFSTLNNLAGSISSLTVSSINGLAPNGGGSGNVTQVNTANTYNYSTSNANTVTQTPTQVAGVATGLFNIVNGAQYLVSCPVWGRAGPDGTLLYAAVSLGSNSSMSWPVAFQYSSGTTASYPETQVIQGVVTATATGATAGGLYLWIWRGNTPTDGSLSVYINSTTAGGVAANNGVTVTRIS